MGIKLLALVLLAMPCLAQEAPQEALRAFKQAYQADMIAKLKHVPKGARIELYAPHGVCYVGRYIGYHKYDTSVWLAEDYHILASAIDISEVLDVRVVGKRAV